jgi:hypothetical protein
MDGVARRRSVKHSSLSNSTDNRRDVMLSPDRERLRGLIRLAARLAAVWPFFFIVAGLASAAALGYLTYVNPLLPLHLSVASHNTQPAAIDNPHSQQAVANRPPVPSWIAHPEALAFPTRPKPENRSTIVRPRYYYEWERAQGDAEDEDDGAFVMRKCTPDIWVCKYHLRTPRMLEFPAH